MSRSRFLSFRKKSFPSSAASVPLRVMCAVGALTLTGAVFFYSSVETADSSSGTADALSSKHSGSAPGRAASRIFIDPQTGKLMATPTNSAALALPPEYNTALSTSTAGLKIETGAGGGKMVRLQGRFRHLNIVTVQDDSLTGIRCVDPGLKATRQTQESHK